MIDNIAGSKDWILNRPDRPVTRVPIAEWQGEVYVRALTAEQKEDYELWFNSMDPPIGATNRLAAMGLCNEDGTSQDWSEHEIEQLSAKHGGAVERIAARVKELTWLTDEDLEEAEKN